MTARVPPATPPYAPEVQAVFDRLPRSWMPPFELFTVMARDPRLLQRFTRGAPIYFPETNLTVRQREVFLDRVTALCRCEYEWSLRIHYFAKEAGLTEEQVRATVHGSAEDASWSADDRLLIRLADELNTSADVSDGLWRELAAALSPEAILELLLLAGYYRTIAYVADGLRLPLEPRATPRFPPA